MTSVEIKKPRDPVANRNMRKKVESVSADVIGMGHSEAIDYIESMGLQCRNWLINGDGCYITGDTRIDRIGLVVWKGFVVGTKNG